MDEGICLNSGITSAGVRRLAAAMRVRLLPQDCLSNLIELGPDVTAVEVTGTMTGYLPVQRGHGPLIRQMAGLSTRIVSLTVTEGGQYRTTSTFNADHADIRQDIENPGDIARDTVVSLACLPVRDRQCESAGQVPFA